MKRNLILIALPLLMMSCGGGESTDAPVENEPSQEENATTLDMETVEATEQAKAKAEHAASRADSILNNL